MRRLTLLASLLAVALTPAFAQDTRGRGTQTARR